MKIGVSSYSYNQYLSDGRMTPDGAVRKAKEMGFDAIEFTDFNLVSPDGEDTLSYAKKIKAVADECGIEISSFVVGANLGTDDNKAEIDRLKKCVDITSALGAKLFRHDVVSPEMYNYFRSFDMALPTIAAAVNEVSDYAKTLGIKTMTENHGFICQDSDRVERLINAVNNDNYGALIDIGNFMCADEEPPIAVSRLANLAFLVHAKDFEKFDFYEYNGEEGCFQTRACNYLRGVSVGCGDVYAEQCLAILKKAGYDGYIIIEYEGVDDCIVGISNGFNFIKSVL